MIMGDDLPEPPDAVDRAWIEVDEGEANGPAGALAPAAAEATAGGCRCCLGTGPPCAVRGGEPDDDEVLD